MPTPTKTTIGSSLQRHHHDRIAVNPTLMLLLLSLLLQLGYFPTCVLGETVLTKNGYTYITKKCDDATCTQNCVDFGSPDSFTVDNGCVTFTGGFGSLEFICTSESQATFNQWSSSQGGNCPADVTPETANKAVPIGCVPESDGSFIMSKCEPPEKENSNDGGVSIGVIVGIVVAAVGLAGVSVAVLFFVVKRKRSPESDGTTTDDATHPDANHHESPHAQRENTDRDVSDVTERQDVETVAEDRGVNVHEDPKIDENGKDTSVFPQRGEEQPNQGSCADLKSSGDPETAYNFRESAPPSAEIPPARCFSRSPKLSFNEALEALLLCDPPENRPDLLRLIPDKDDVSQVIYYVERLLPSVKASLEVAPLLSACGLTDDDVRALIAYKIESPFPVYKWLNALLVSGHRGERAVSNVGPFFTLLFRAQEKLPKVTKRAARSVIVKNIPALQATFVNYLTRLAPGSELNFWGFSSFSTDDTVINSKAFMGDVHEEAIVYTCPDVTGVNMEPFRPPSIPAESEILPLAPAMFRVVAATMIGKKLTVVMTQVANTDDAYIAPANGMNAHK